MTDPRRLANFNEIRSHVMEAIASEKRGDSLAALQSIDRALALHEPESGFHYMRGCYLLGLDRAPDAVGALQRSVALDPTNAAAFNNLGTAFFVTGKHEEAVNAFRQAASLDPAMAKARFNLGNALAARGAFEEAGQAFWAAVESDENCVEAYWRGADAFLRAGNVDMALHCGMRLTYVDDSSGNELMDQITRAGGTSRRAGGGTAGQE